MGSNMQRQGVPLLARIAATSAPAWKEGIARDSRSVVVAEGDGKVAAATAEVIVTTNDGKLRRLRPEAA